MGFKGAFAGYRGSLEEQRPANELAGLCGSNLCQPKKPHKSSSLDNSDYSVALADNASESHALGQENGKSFIQPAAG